MKHRLYSISILALGLFVLAACSGETATSAPIIDEPAQAQIYRLDDNGEPGRGISFPITIGSVSDSEVGYLMVSNDAENLYLTYNMIGSWLLKDGYIHIGNANNVVPVDDTGKPILDRFPYDFELARGARTYLYRIALSELGAEPGQNVVIASFASVIQDMVESDSISRDPRGQSWWFMTDYRIRRYGIGEDIGGESLDYLTEIKREY